MSRSLIFLGLLVLSTAAGCGGTNQQPLTGIVTWQGKPIERGAINLFPKSNDGITVGSEINEGKFSISKKSGPTPGKYRVEIIAFRKTKKTEFDVDQNKQIVVEEQYLPIQFNQSSTLEAEISSGKPNELNFELKAER